MTLPPLPPLNWEDEIASAAEAEMKCVATFYESNAGNPPTLTELFSTKGREEGIGDRCGLGREGERLGQLGLELDGGQAAEGVLGSLPVILPLDPDDDGEPQILPGGPPLLVEDVGLQVTALTEIPHFR